MAILLETIVSSLDDARTAAAGGSDRFECCAGLALGGLTPSLGLLQAIKAELSVPVMFMIRPREGGMAYSRGEVAAMERDAELALAHGADGLVFGFLTPEGAVDVNQTRQFLKPCMMMAPGRQWVFHRAFDVVRDAHVALEQLIDLGVTRVLTSGRAAAAIEGLDEIRRTVEQADGRIEVLPGGGIGLADVLEVVRGTGVTQVHMSITAVAEDSSASHNPRIRFGANLPQNETEVRIASAAMVREVKQLLAQTGS